MEIHGSYPLTLIYLTPFFDSLGMFQIPFVAGGLDVELAARQDQHHPKPLAWQFPALGNCEVRVQKAAMRL